MHHMQLDLSILSGLLQFRVHGEVPATILVQPIAHRKVKLPSNKVILREDEVSRILPKEMLRKCSKNVTTLQSNHKGLKEVDISLEIPNIGVFSVETLRTMPNYHRAIDAIAAIDKAIVW
ncbi:hypothetical protein GQ600_9392 [Phytophthora cactorum]|nr:hypothetical protein GQ600_9392 [Phytophthora cactorum]